MSIIEQNISFPLDDDGFFRRQCPLCTREFKIKMTKEELTDIAQKGLEDYLLQADLIEQNDDHGWNDGQEEPFCPYCGQQSTWSDWWTDEQSEFIGVIVHNIAADIMNPHLKKMEKTMRNINQSGFVSMKMSATKMDKKEPWISPEENDLIVFPLPCCDRELKIDDDWNGTVHCHFCGFPHQKL